MKLQKLLLGVMGILICSLLSGGVFAEEQKTEEGQEKFVTKVNFGARVEREEALAIGREFLQFQKIAGEYYTTKFGVGAGFLVKEVGGVWHVVFLKKKKSDREGSQQSIRIIIDAKNGEVMGREIQEGFYLERRQR